MNENLKNDAINSLTKIQECLGVTGENGGTSFLDAQEYFSSQIEIQISDIRPFEDLDDEQVKDKLAVILKNSREKAEKNLTTILHIFAIQYANVMIERDFSTKEYKEIVEKAGVKETLYEEIRKGVSIYKIISEKNPPKEISSKTYTFENYEYKAIENNSEKKFNRIIFGAPGTGKSYQIDKAKDELKDIAEFERVTFHPNYSYAQFVGTYKPVTKDDGDIAYKYVEGPFMRLLTAALENAKDKNKDNRKRYLLIVEEINRANVAAVFGDMFQLLDRDTDGVSDYEIQTSEDVRKYLAAKLGGDGTEAKYKTLKLPNNFYIWATMNSADQGVQPMDAAFKRRWNFEYLNIDEGKFEVDISIPNGYEADGKTQKWVDLDWDTLRTSINDTLKKIPGVNEDKLLGPFFIGNKDKIEQLKQNKDEFNELFKSKILMYLFEDVVKMNPSDLFNKKEGENVHYSDICKEFDQKGLKIFVKSISDKFDEFKTGDNN